MSDFLGEYVVALVAVMVPIMGAVVVTRLVQGIR